MDSELELTLVDCGVGFCRCCLSQGCYKNIHSEHIHLGEKEVYYEMIKSCFNILFNEVPDEDQSKQLICEICIEKLREAVNFRKTILLSEEQLLLGNISTAAASNEQVQLIKVEPEHGGESEAEYYQIEFLEDDVPTNVKDELEYGDSKDFDAAEEPYQSDEEVYVPPVKRGRGRPRKYPLTTTTAAKNRKYPKGSAKAEDTPEGAGLSTSLDKPKDTAKDTVQYKTRDLTKLPDLIRIQPADLTKPFDLTQPYQNGDPQSSSIAERSNRSLPENAPDSAKSGAKSADDVNVPKHEDRKQKKSKQKKTERHAAIQKGVNAEILIECTNLHPFRVFFDAISCVYCKDTFYDPVAFREHFDSKHTNFNMAAIKKTWPIKVDTFALHCKICGSTLQSVNEAAEHLKVKHKKRIKGSNYGLMPYKLISSSIYECVNCDKRFTKFLDLNEHVNEHYHKFVCDCCGAGFIWISDLNVHITRYHLTVHKCRVCAKTFDRHNDMVKCYRGHAVFPCTECNERFNSRERLRIHLATVHKRVEKLYKCTQCELVFKVPARRREHVLQVHLSDKAHKCGVCGMRFPHLNMLKTHSVRHTDARNFVCSVCSKTFKYKKGLCYHMRSHH